VWIQGEDVSSRMLFIGINAATNATAGASMSECGPSVFTAQHETGESELAYFGRPCFDGDAIWFPMCSKYAAGYDLSGVIRRIPRSGTR
jgi:hypothetical protein